MMSSSNLETRVIKILCIIFCIVSSYVVFHYVTDEVYFEGFPSIFVGFIEIYLNGHISLDYFLPMPLFSSSIQTDTSLSSMAQRVMVTESYFPNFVMLFLIMNYITGLSSQVLVILPLGILFIPIAYLAMIKAYVPTKNHSIYHTTLGTYIILYLGATKMYGSFYVAPPSFLIILIIFLSLRKSYENSSNRTHYMVVCLSILSLAHYWHTALAIVLFFIVSLWLVLGLFYIFRRKQAVLGIFSASTWLFIISIVISLTFIHLWQSPYIGDFFRTADISDFILKVWTRLIGLNPFPVPYGFNYKDLLWGKMYFTSILLIYILSTLILIISLVSQISSIRKGGDGLIPSMTFMFGLSVILSQIVNAFLYYKATSINFFYAPFFFAIFGVSIFVINSKEKRFRKFTVFCLLLMCTLSLISNIALYFTNEAGETSLTKFKDTRISFEWLYMNMDRSRKVITDFNILGKYLQREAMVSKPSIEYEHISPRIYAALVGDDEIPTDLNKSYLVVDHATMSAGLPINSYAIRALLLPKWKEIDNCRNQDKIYEDNHLSVFIFKERA